MKKLNLEQAFAGIHDYWNPHVVADLNGQHVRIAKIKGLFPMHQHELEDEMFLVHKGQLTMHYQDQDPIVLKQGELLVIPKGTMHAPEAEEVCEIILFEPAETRNTGNSENEFTRNKLERLA